VGGASEVGGQRFFLKKEAKTFATKACALGQRARFSRKSFLVLFFKKEPLHTSAFLTGFAPSG
jgi:hypothetical protein